MKDFDRRSVLQAAGAALLTMALPLRDARAGWKEDWEHTLEAAKKEGALTVSASSNRSRRAFVEREWAKAFPDIKLTYQVVSGSRFVPAVVTERKAGKYLWDVWHSGPPSGFAAMRAKLLDPLLPELILPEVNDPKVWGGWEEAFYDPQSQYLLGLFDDITAPYFNARKLDPEKVKRLGLKVLLEPELKGKICWIDPRVRGPGGPYLVLLDHVVGPDNLRRLLADQDIIFVTSENEAAEAVVRGRAVVALGNRPGEALRKYVKAGLDLDIRSFGNDPGVGWKGTGGGTIGLFNKRPHPNAARVFVNWIATREVSVGLSHAQDLNSARSDVPPLDPRYSAIPGAHYVNGQREDSNKIVREWMVELKKIRPQ